MTYVVACDLGTGGNKTILVDHEGEIVASVFNGYETFTPKPGWHEQSPNDWLTAVVDGIRGVVEMSGVAGSDVAAIGLSGQSLGVIPLDARGNVLLDPVPIWSDSRADEQAKRYFAQVPHADWYKRTGNGFPAALYPMFKAMWLADNAPQVLSDTRWILGSKDFVNFRLSGRYATDVSYASGSGFFDLHHFSFDRDLLAPSGIESSLWPEPLASTDIVGYLTQEMSTATGLRLGTPIVAGGVDNATMALGSRNTLPGRVYNALGSSAWISVSGASPIIDSDVGTYVFAHVIPEMYTSAVSIFSAGTTLAWIRDLVGGRSSDENDDVVWERLMADASLSPLGASGLIMNPTLAGGTSLEGGVHVRGGIMGLRLDHSRSDLVRAAVEGIGLALGSAFSALKTIAEVESEVLVVGGGSQSELWRQTLADIYQAPIVTTSVGRNAAALGAAALALKGVGVWSDLRRIDEVHVVAAANEPVAENVSHFEDAAQRYSRFAELLRTDGERME